MNKKVKIPEPTIARLPVYYNTLMDLKSGDITIVSSAEISSRTGVKASQFRKDMSYFGEFGIQGLGYPVNHLIDRVASILQINKTHEVAVFGVGNLGQALIRYPGFSRWGFKIARIFDNDPQKVGQEINGIIIESSDDLPEKLELSVAILSVPAPVAQETAERVIKAGIKSILNFSSAKLRVPADVVVRNVDLTHELAILAYYHSNVKQA